MGHALFVLLHLAALLFSAMFLFLTIPLHLIYAAASSRRRDPEAPGRRTHLRCPDCRELVRKDATRCRHCGIPLIRQA